VLIRPLSVLSIHQSNRLFDVIDSDSDWFGLMAPQLAIAVAVLEEEHVTRAAVCGVAVFPVGGLECRNRR
jgi:hypothetical protein